MSGSDAATSPTDIYSLYSDHHSWLLALLRHRLACPSLAEDLSHDVFVRLLGKAELPVFLEPRAYLARVAHGLVIDRHRRQQVERAWLEAATSLPEEKAPSAEDEVVIIDALARIDALLDKLAPRARLAFLMSRLEGLGYDEIAAQLGVSRSTVQKDLTQALRHCYRVLMG